MTEYYPWRLWRPDMAQTPGWRCWVEGHELTGEAGPVTLEIGADALVIEPEIDGEPLGYEHAIPERWRVWRLQGGYRCERDNPLWAVTREAVQQAQAIWPRIPALAEVEAQVQEAGRRAAYVGPDEYQGGGERWRAPRHLDRVSLTVQPGTPPTITRVLPERQRR